MNTCHEALRAGAGDEMRSPVETASGLSAVLRGVVADMQHASGADIVSIFLYDESTRSPRTSCGLFTPPCVRSRFMRKITRAGSGPPRRTTKTSGAAAR